MEHRWKFDSSAFGADSTRDPARTRIRDRRKTCKGLRRSRTRREEQRQHGRKWIFYVRTTHAGLVHLTRPARNSRARIDAGRFTHGSRAHLLSIYRAAHPGRIDSRAPRSRADRVRDSAAIGSGLPGERHCFGSGGETGTRRSCAIGNGTAVGLSGFIDGRQVFSIRSSPFADVPDATQSTTTGDDGEFEFPSVPAGDWTLRAESDSVRDEIHQQDVIGFGSATISLGDRDLDDVRIQLVLPVDFSGSIEGTDDHRPQSPAPWRLP